MHQTTLETENRRLRDRVEVLEEELRQLREAQQPVASFPISWRLTKTEENLLFILYSVTGWITRERLSELLYAASHDVQPDSLQVYVCRLRRKLAAASTCIKISTRYNFGWTLTPTSRSAIANALGDGQHPIRRAAA